MRDTDYLQHIRRAIEQDILWDVVQTKLDALYAKVVEILAAEEPGS